MLNDLACLRIPTMSTAAVSGVASLGDSGNEGTKGLGAAAGGVGIGWGGFRGEVAGDNWAKVVVKYRNETSCTSEKEKRYCFCIVILVLMYEGSGAFGKQIKCRICISNEHLMH